MTKTRPCFWCGASVESDAEPLHRDWHIAHSLHGPRCAQVLRDHAQRGTDMYFPPVPCDCGLIA